MNIREFSNQLLKLYQEMSDSFSSYQNSTRWSCLAGCGKCCLNPDVEATLFEMIPMALRIYDEGLFDEWVEKLETSEQEYCLLYKPGDGEGKGRCGSYADRPSLCRMFGVAGYYNKNQELTLSICKLIRDEYKITELPVGLNQDTTPNFAQWSYRMATLDQKLIQEKMPINKALLAALQKVGLYAQYQDDAL